MMIPNKDMVIEALVGRFGQAVIYGEYCIVGLAEAGENADLIRASCENIYQYGYLQGKHDALQKSLKALKGDTP